MAIVLIDSYSESNQDDYLPLYQSDQIEAGGQSFIGDGSILDRCVFDLRRVGSPTGYAYAKIYAHTGTFGVNGEPTGSALAVSAGVDVTTIGTGAHELVIFNFTGTQRIVLTQGTKYFVVCEYIDGPNSTNCIRVGYDSSSPSHAGNGAHFEYTYWVGSAAMDYIFYVYAEKAIEQQYEWSGGLPHTTYLDLFEWLGGLPYIFNQEVPPTIHTFTETGSGAETLLTDKVLIITDSGSGVDVLLVDKVLIFVETGAGVEVWTVEIGTVVFADTGVGVDVLLVDKISTFVDSGAGAESWTVDKLKAFADSGVGTDVFLKDWTPIFTESGSGVEAYYKVFPYPPNLKRIIIYVRGKKG